MVAAGFDEAVTFSFIDAEEAALFGHDKTVRVDELVRKTNNSLRPTLLPSLLRACKTNQDAGNAGASLFELAAVFPPSAGGGLPDEHVELGLATTGDLSDLRGALEAMVLRVVPAARLELHNRAWAGLADDASAELVLDGRGVGAIGLISPRVQGYYGLEYAAAVARMRFDAMLAHAGRTRTYAPLPRFPAARRDISFIVDEPVTWARLAGTIQAVEQPMREGLEHVITYRGQPIPRGRKSVTVKLTYRSPEGTLRSEDVDEQVRRVIEAVKDKLSAEVRR